MVAINTPVVELVHLLSGLSLQRNAADAVDMSCKHVHNLSRYIIIYIILMDVYVAAFVAIYHIYKEVWSASVDVL